MPKNQQRHSLLAFMAILIVGCSPAGVAERQLENQLPKYIGPADSYDVDIEGLQLSDNTAERILVLGERVKPEGAPVLDRLELELLGVRYDRRAGRLEQVESAQAAVSVNGSDLAMFLEAQDAVREASVELNPPDRATILISPRVGDFPLPAGITVDAEGQFMGQGSQVHFEITAVRAAGLDLGNGLAQIISRQINPVIDLAGLPVTLQVKSITVDNDAVRIEVTGDPNSFQLP